MRSLILDVLVRDSAIDQNCSISVTWIHSHSRAPEPEPFRSEPEQTDIIRDPAFGLAFSARVFTPAAS